MVTANTVIEEGRKALHERLLHLERTLDGDVLAIVGDILPGADAKVRAALEAFPSRRKRLSVVLHTYGGILPVAERMVTIFRHLYGEVIFIIPDVAMSVGTVPVMAGDEIWMDYYSCLGPIDPQVQRTMKDGTLQLIPALSYLSQFKRLIQKSADGTLTTAEMILLQNFDLAELHAFEEAKEQAVELIVTWLSQYKFKDWKETQTKKKNVTPELREKRAREIADKLSAHEHWHSHGRGIPMSTLQRELNLLITDFGSKAAEKEAIENYFALAKSFMEAAQFSHFVHSREFV